MPPSADAPALLDALLMGAGGLYLLSLVVLLARPAWARAPLALGVALHLAATVWRGVLIGFFPLTNKFESFSTAALALGLVTVVAWRPVRLYAAPLLALTAGTLGVAWTFGRGLGFPPPLMNTLWYPLHVPLSFVAYALWAAAAAAGLAWARTREKAWLERVDHLALQGFGLWSLSMIFGGLWGAVAWGAYFLWDPKVLWSVILWFHYASFVHLRLTPSLRTRPWVRPALAGVGLVWVFVAYVGTSFFFGGSSHAF